MKILTILIFGCFSSLSFAAPIRITNVTQLDNIVANNGRATLVWDSSKFSSPEQAQLAYDAIKLAQAGNFWVSDDGAVHGEFDMRFQVWFVNPNQDFNTETRTEILFKFLSERFINMKPSPYTLDHILAHLPEEFEFIRHSLRTLSVIHHSQQMNDFMNGPESADMLRALAILGSPAPLDQTILQSPNDCTDILVPEDKD